MQLHSWLPPTTRHHALLAAAVLTMHQLLHVVVLALPMLLGSTHADLFFGQSLQSVDPPHVIAAAGGAEEPQRLHTVPNWTSKPHQQHQL